MLHFIVPLLLILQFSTGLPPIDHLKTLPNQEDGGSHYLSNSSSHIVIRDNSHATEVITQENPELELKFVSQEEGTSVLNLFDFKYRAPAGAKNTVWVHDSGINLDHEEFASTQPDPRVTRGKIDWLYAKKDYLRKPFSKSLPKPTKDEDGHGTCVADKIVGLKYGVAKSANLKMVPVIIDLDNLDYMIARIRTIVKDIKKEKKAAGGKLFPIVNLSYGIPNYEEAVVNAYRKAFKDLVALDTVIVVAAGNDGHIDVDSYPALFAREDRFKSHMLVVGSVNIDGERSDFSQGGDLVNIWAPGTVYADDGITCARHDDNTGTTREEGTSFAAPQVAGLAAYYLSVYEELRVPGSAAPKVIAKIKETAYARFEDGDDCIWNGEAGTDWCDWGG